MKDMTPCPRKMSLEDKAEILAANSLESEKGSGLNVMRFSRKIDELGQILGYIPCNEELVKEFKNRWNIDLEKSGFWS